jgi:hypothetical protein
MRDSQPHGLSARLSALLDREEWAQLAFTPVPVRARHDGWTVERQRGSIARLALCGCISASARAVGKTKKAAYDLRNHEGGASFAAAWDKALGWGRGRAVDLALERGIVGEVRPVFYRGRRCGEQIRHDNRLLFAALKASGPVLALPSTEEIELLRQFTGDFG